MATSDSIATQINTLTTNIQSAVDSAQAQLSAQLLGSFTASYTAVTAPGAVAAVDIYNSTSASMEAAVATVVPDMYILGTDEDKIRPDLLIKPELSAGTNLFDDSITTKYLAATTGYIAQLKAIPDLVSVADIDLSTMLSPTWTDTDWSSLKTQLAAFTSTILSTDGVDAVLTKLTSDTSKLQVAMYAADRERKQQGLRDLFSAANAATGARGFSYPNSMTTALKLAAQQQYTFDLSQVSRDLIKMLSEWAKSTFQFSAEKQIAATSADMDFNTRFATISAQVYAEKVQYEVAKLKAAVEKVTRVMEAEITVLKLRFESANSLNEIVMAKDKTKLALAEVNLRGLQLSLGAAEAGKDYTLALDNYNASAAVAAADANFKFYTEQVRGQLDALKTDVEAARDAYVASTTMMASVSTGLLGIVN